MKVVLEDGRCTHCEAGHAHSPELKLKTELELKLEFESELDILTGTKFGDHLNQQLLKRGGFVMLPLLRCSMPSSSSATSVPLGFRPQSKKVSGPLSITWITVT